MPSQARSTPKVSPLVRKRLARIRRTLPEGFVRKLVEAVAPATEADPLAILLHLLTAFGNVIGRHAHFPVGGTRHYLNLFALFVGDTASGRKGTAWDYVRALFAAVDAPWVTSRISTGLSTGPGLISAVSDVPPEELDGAVQDKRLLVVESEFGAVPRLAKGPSSILSHVIRKAWDDGQLQIMTKSRPLTATNAHISIIGHATTDELRKEFRTVDTRNGFANRFIWCRVSKSQDLPNGGPPVSAVIAPFVAQFADRVDFGRSVVKMRRSKKADRLWAKHYGALGTGGTGVAAALTGRGQPQVLRLSCVYALLDRSAVVKVKHLKAALSLWRLARISAVKTLGAGGHPAVERAIVEALTVRKRVSKKAIRDLFQRNLPGAVLDSVLADLRRRGVAACKRDKVEGQQGRPPEVWSLRTTKRRKNSQGDSSGQHDQP